MKAAAVRRLAETKTALELEASAEALMTREEDLLDIEGDDTGEKLTHCMLALRVRARMEQGELLKDAFRAEMAAVRAVLENEE